MTIWEFVEKLNAYTGENIYQDVIRDAEIITEQIDHDATLACFVPTVVFVSGVKIFRDQSTKRWEIVKSTELYPDFICSQMQRDDLTEKEAIQITESGVYKQLGMARYALLQLQQSKLCGDFGYFHESVEFLLGRGVWTHEFINAQALVEEACGRKDSPSFQEIVDLIPKDKQILLVSDEK